MRRWWELLQLRDANDSYGEIVPRSEVSRMLTTVEAVTGQLYIAVLVARLVGLHIARTGDQSIGKE